MDPIVTAGLVKAAESAGDESVKEVGGLLTRVLGPAADEIGEALRRYTSGRVNNVERIVSKAEQKSAGRGSGKVPPRIAHRLLETGSYCDDELMAEYLSGVLAAGRTPNGRDDRGIAWSAMITDMSVLQIRAHFLLYREWAALLNGRSDIQLSLDAGRQRCDMYLDADEFRAALARDMDIEGYEALAHAIPGIVRIGLLGDSYAWGPKDNDTHAMLSNSPWEPALCVQPSLAGIELYGWAQGLAGMTGQSFVSDAVPFAEDEIPRLHNVAVPGIEAPAGS